VCSDDKKGSCFESFVAPLQKLDVPRGARDANKGCARIWEDYNQCDVANPKQSIPGQPWACGKLLDSFLHCRGSYLYPRFLKEFDKCRKEHPDESTWYHPTSEPCPEWLSKIADMELMGMKRHLKELGFQDKEVSNMNNKHMDTLLMVHDIVEEPKML